MLSEQFLPIFQAFDASVSLVCRRQPCQDVFLQFGTAIASQNSGDTQQSKEHEVMESVGFLLSVKRRRYDPFQSLESWLPLLIAAVVLIVLIWAILKFLSKMHEDVDPAEADREMLQALREFTGLAHRCQWVRERHGVNWYDDSKATNAHAAQTSLAAYDPIVWIAGGMAKGQEFDELVRAARPRLRGVVLLGVDQDVLGQALARHAPDVPVIAVRTTETGAMAEVVQHAASLAQSGDTVLLAPGCASWDMFRDYTDRGRQFADAVASLPGFLPRGSHPTPF